MNRLVSLIRYRQIFHSIRYLNENHSVHYKNFDEKTFDYILQRRLQLFNGTKQQMLNDIHMKLESLLNTSTVENDLMKYNHTKTFSKSLTIEQFRDILFYAYEKKIKLNYLTKSLLECLLPYEKIMDTNLFIGLINLFVLHEQKYYDTNTKRPNTTLEKFINEYQSSLSEKQIENICVTDLTLLCSAMYRLQIAIKNPSLLEYIAQMLIDDEQKKHLSAVDKQNFLKILTLSNYKRVDLAQSLLDRFNESFKKHRQLDLTSFSYEIVRLMMRISIYLLTIQYYSKEFFEHCLILIENQTDSIAQVYRAKDIIQIMNTLIYMGYIRTNSSKYEQLINHYYRINKREQRPERLVDVLAPLAMIGYFSDNLLEKLFKNDNFKSIHESRLKEKLFFISQSSKIFKPNNISYELDQSYIDSLPKHIFGSWKIEKEKRPNFSHFMEKLSECVPNHRYIKSEFLLKHFKSPNIIIYLNDKQQPQIISNSQEININTQSSIFKYAIEVLSKEDMCVNVPNRPIGFFYSKAYQLKILNYIPVIVYPHDNLNETKNVKDTFKWIIERAKTTELLLNN